MCKNPWDFFSFMEEHRGCIVEDKLQPFLLTLQHNEMWDLWPARGMGESSGSLDNLLTPWRCPRATSDLLFSIPFPRGSMEILYIMLPMSCRLRNAVPYGGEVLHKNSQASMKIFENFWGQPTGYKGLDAADLEMEHYHIWVNIRVSRE